MLDLFAKDSLKLLADTVLLISIVDSTGLVYLPKLRTIVIPFIEIPVHFQPTTDRALFDSVSSTALILIEYEVLCAERFPSSVAAILLQKNKVNILI
jgi:hypothetical protein